MFLSIGVLCSCTDTWDEHYGGNSENSQAFDGTIMDFLKQNSNLSDFVEIVEATGYDLELNSSQSFTIWAPVNGSFDKNEWLELAKTNKQDVITRFIKNHMTRYNVSLDNQKLGSFLSFHHNAHPKCLCKSTEHLWIETLDRPNFL